MGQLNELQSKAAQPRDSEYMLADGQGLYLRVRPNGKVWVYRYTQSGKPAKRPRQPIAIALRDSPVVRAISR